MTGTPYQPAREPTPWAPGLAVAALVAALTAAGVCSFGAALAQVHWTLAVAVNLIAVGGAAPTAWRWRETPVTRWVLAGMTVGVLLGWIVLLIAAVAA
ncbi:DUF2537 domain-containing protein [Nocardia sp. CDC159]|uniref:DUF2537 domain-containing protein n=1 Tax=Nocardia pulmonis TaxID=2951408 RepID=A0A9X2IVB5_9NOCA|nr:MULTISPECIES: DUF2537 domain-containing protein [Nocardia]MCM6773048.1 DUF2537 domain-containing protein [Nocardia pulmonis]MCM6785649.1 DUF2537 domain-containing protein [Nocardia sp. CDC159]